MPLRYVQIASSYFCNHINVNNTSTIKITLYFHEGEKKNHIPKN